MAIINALLGLGASVIMPIVILILGLVFRMKLKNAIRAGLTVGIGFIGINLALGLVSDNLGGLVSALQERFNLSLSVVDVGWPAASGIAFASGTFAFAVIVACLVTNAVLLLLKLTHTLNVDIFNFWHHIVMGAMTWFVTGNMVLGVVSAVLFYVANTILGERQEHVIREYGGDQWQGITFATQGFPGQLLVGRGINWVLDRIPGIRNIHFNLSELPASVSFFGEPMILGLILGAIMCLLAGYPVLDSITICVQISAAMYLLPRMVSVMMEGLAPLTDAAREFMSTRFPGRQFNIAMDYCMLLGDKDIITMGVLAVPIVLILAFILPGNTFLPFTDLPALVYWMIAPVVATKHNTFRALIVAVISLVLGLYMCTEFAPQFTMLAAQSGYDFAEGTTIASFCMGWEWPGYVIHKIITLIASIFG